MALTLKENMGGGVRTGIALMVGVMGGVLVSSGTALAFSSADLLRLPLPLPFQPGASPPPTEVDVSIAAPQATADHQPRLPEANKAASTKTLKIQGFRVRGSERYPETELVALLDDSVGKELDFTQLQALTTRLSEHYHRHGFEAAQAYLPVQQVRGGIVEFVVSEGQVGQINVVTDRPDDADDLRPYLHQQTGQPLRLDALEQDLLALAELPGVRSRIVLTPSQEPGRTDLSLYAQRETRLVGQVGVSNVALLPNEPGQGEALLVWRHAGAIGTSLTTRLTAMGQGNYRSQATFSQQADGMSAGLDLAYLEYTLDPQPAQNIDMPPVLQHGRAAMVAVDAAINLLRQPGRTTRLSSRLALRSYHDQTDTLIADHAVETLTLGWSDQRHSLNQRQSFEGSITAGYTSVSSDPADSTVSTGPFLLLASRWALAAHLDPHWNVTTRTDAQWADRSLARSEQLLLSGSQAVRAYDMNDARVDTGLVASAEIRRTSTYVDGYAFGDIGWGVLNQAPAWSVNWFNRESLGVGLELRPLPKMRLTTQLAWKTIDTAPRLWLNLTQAF
jgi:hemolysin activation/secretion protein